MCLNSEVQSTDVRRPLHEAIHLQPSAAIHVCYLLQSIQPVNLLLYVPADVDGGSTGVRDCVDGGPAVRQSHLRHRHTTEWTEGRLMKGFGSPTYVPDRYALSAADGCLHTDSHPMCMRGRHISR